MRYESFGVSWDTWLRWGEGETVAIKLPRNSYKESAKYKGTAPIFASMASLFQYPLTEAKKFQRDVEYENGQFRTRWDIVRFNCAIPVAERDVTIKPCGKCGAEWFAAVLPPKRRLTRKQAPVAPDAGFDRAPKRRLNGKQKPAGAATFKSDTVSSSVRTQSALPCVATPAFAPASAASTWSRFQQLMAWQAGGLLTQQEFANAKRMLGL